GVGLARAAVPAAIVRDDAVSVAEEEHHLVVPVVCAQRPAVVEDDRLRVLRTPVLVEDLGAVSGGDKAHENPPAEGTGRQDRRRCLERADGGAIYRNVTRNRSRS